MILPRLTYKKAQSVSAAIVLYKDCSEKACYLAGGTDLIPLIKLRLLRPAVIIDLKGIDELKTISRRSNWLVVGPNVTLFDLKNDPTIREYFPSLYESLDATSCETLQMRGTIGGNILQDARCLQYNKSLEWRTARGFCFKMGGRTCNVVPKTKACFANYSSDNAPSLITLATEVKLVGVNGERTVKLEKIFTGDGRKPFAIEAGEILTEILIPMKKTKGTYEKLRVRNSMDYPLIGVAVSMTGNNAKVCVGGVGLIPRLYDKKVSEAAINEVADKAYNDAKPVTNSTLSPPYRKKMIAVLIKRAIRKVLQEGK